MHLYQYLPGTFKATSSNEFGGKTKNGSIDMTASTAKSSNQSSVDRTLKVSNLSKNRNKNLHPHQQRALSSSPRTTQRPVVGFDRYSHDRYQPPPKQRTAKKPTSPYPTTVGRGFSQDDSVVSDVTNATTLTFPKVGPGYSDTISVNSDLTIPTIAPGTVVPEEELQDMDEWHAAQATSADREQPGSGSRGYTRTRRSPNFNGEQSLTSILEDEEDKKVTFDKESKSTRYSPKEVDSRLELLKKMSMKEITSDEAHHQSSSAPRSSHSVASNSSWKGDKPPTRTPADSMEDIVWTTLLHLEEESVCDNDNESVAAPILNEMGRGRQRHQGGDDSSLCSESTEGRRRNRRRGSQSQAQGFSFVW